MSISSVLVANRGEIAVRVARTCRELGLRCVAVYSTQDRDSAVVRLADQAVHIGPAPARNSYLNIPAIIEAARAGGVDAIHPGYGFLSENADFAEICEDEGFTFIGPPAEVMSVLGDKSTARAAMLEAGLPLLPGSREPLTHAHEAHALADDIGYPVIIKAVAGGGGRGMRVVHTGEHFVESFNRTRADAQMLFGDGRVYVERYLPSARHVEIQVLCDAHGNAVHLGERDCSVQRRHQKLVEESPAPALPDGLAERMGKAAVQGALSAGYVGAGTFEFLVDPAGDFFFMEVNCRLQVEHPVTEMVTGIDLVAEQIRVADGQPLGYGQEDVQPRGAAIECRINAENPQRGFAPAPGTVTEFVAPAGAFVRTDTHLHRGYRIPTAYDSLLAKVIVWAEHRDAAIARMRRALAELELSGPGVHTTAAFLQDLLQDERFVRATHDTSLIDHLL